LRSAHVLGLNIAGVDLLRSKKGPLVLEVNSSPGLEGIEAATKVDVAGAMIALLAAQVEMKSSSIKRKKALPTLKKR
jgi:ribosomal protein S6--L-glutamate ligase